MIKLEVRCCCQPQKVLGYLNVSGPLVAGRNVEFAKKLSMSSLDSLVGMADGQVYVETHTIQKVSLPIAKIVLPGRGVEFAIKAEGMTVEQLEEIAGFQSA